jgi:hypothetical protein
MAGVPIGADWDPSPNGIPIPFQSVKIFCGGVPLGCRFTLIGQHGLPRRSMKSIASSAQFHRIWDAIDFPHNYLIFARSIGRRTAYTVWNCVELCGTLASVHGRIRSNIRTRSAVRTRYVSPPPEQRHLYTKGNGGHVAAGGASHGPDPYCRDHPRTSPISTDPAYGPPPARKSTRYVDSLLDSYQIISQISALHVSVKSIGCSMRRANDSSC